jgi:hypothetical protein
MEACQNPDTSQLRSEEIEIGRVATIGSTAVEGSMPAAQESESAFQKPSQKKEDGSLNLPATTLEKQPVLVAVDLLDLSEPAAVPEKLSTGDHKNGTSDENKKVASEVPNLLDLSLPVETPLLETASVEEAAPPPAAAAPAPDLLDLSPAAVVDVAQPPVFELSSEPIATAQPELLPQEELPQSTPEPIVADTAEKVSEDLLPNGPMPATPQIVEDLL